MKLTVTYPSGAAQAFEPKIAMPPPIPRPAELWTLSMRLTPTATQFLPWTLFPKPVDGTGGQANYLNINGRHLAFERAINTYEVMQSLIWEQGGSIYIVDPKEAAQGKKWKDCTSVRWPMLCLAGHNPDKTPVRNLVSVVEHYGNWVRIEGIPHDAILDPTVINHTNTPWLVHRVWCGREGLNDLPHGIGNMGIWKPKGFTGTPAEDSDLWLKAEALEARVD